MGKPRQELPTVILLPSSRAESNGRTHVGVLAWAQLHLSILTELRALL